METIFSQKHLIGLIWVALLVTLMLMGSLLLGRRIGTGTVLRVAAVVFVSLEIAKFIALGENIDISYFPLQFCSLMLYAYPVAAFARGKVKQAVLPFAYVAGLMAGVIALLMPTNILGDPGTGWLSPDNFYPTLSFVYHGFMIYFSLYLVLSKEYSPRWRHIGNVTGLSLVFSWLAIGMNAIYDTDLMMLNHGEGNPLNFLLEVGWIWYYLSQLVLVVVVSLLVIAVTKGFFFITDARRLKS
ncbi:MAG: YwaF family protein [Peptococcaceae bacterium]|nr:YwaF family protein [Peptococcaceae bacterium]